MLMYLTQYFKDWSIDSIRSQLKSQQVFLWKLESGF